jgi:NitT/TauT family transport system ATP-binding protein
MSRSGAPVHALNDVNLSIGKGQFITLLGPSGCGKSTLLRLIGGLVQKTKGSIRMAGVEVTRPTNSVGMVFQAPLLLPWRNVLQNTMLAADLGRVDRKAARERAIHYLDLVGLHQFHEKYPGELSGGMQQRVGIARALVHDPDVLLMDEPFAALDAMTRDRLQIELRSLWGESGKTIIFVTHSISEAIFLADRVIVLGARPARVIDDIAIALPGTRTLDMINAPEFGAYVSTVRRYFAQEQEAA